VIFHLASPRPEVGKTDQNRTNVLGTQILLACAAKIPSVRVFVYTSCAAAVELSPANSRLTEEQSKLYTAKSRASPYEKSKAIADALVLAANSSGLRTVTLRLPPIYGEGDPILTPNIMTMMRQGKHTIQIGKNQKVFDYVYIDNAIHGHILAAKALLQPSEEKVDGEAFFITDDSPLPFYSFARKIWYAAGDRTENEDIRVVSRGLVLATALINEWFYFVFSLGFKKPEVTFYDVRELEKGMCFSIEKARRRLGYNPVVLLDDGIKLAVDRGLERQDLRVIALRGRPEPDW
jgi:sterol-4alpha-carboxylate 3-dehydrogenase (decarboxylating)